MLNPVCPISFFQQQQQTERLDHEAQRLLQYKHRNGQGHLTLDLKYAFNNFICVFENE